jgi:hypothetical protein
MCAIVATVRGLNRDHNHDLKDIFKGAAMRASTAAGPLHDLNRITILWAGIVQSIWYAILLTAVALAYWVVRELLLNTFRDPRRKKPFIIALAGFSIAVAVIAGGVITARDDQFFILVLATRMILCPATLLGLVFIDIPDPSHSSLLAGGLLAAIANLALYAAIGRRVGTVVLKWWSQWVDTTLSSNRIYNENKG